MSVDPQNGYRRITRPARLGSAESWSGENESGPQGGTAPQQELVAKRQMVQRDSPGHSEFGSRMSARRSVYRPCT